MFDDLYDGLVDEIGEATQILLGRGWSPKKVLDDALVGGMNIVGEDFRDGILFVPEVLLAANAMKAGMAILRPLLTETGTQPVGKMVIGTVKGDIHDIGKNLVGIKQVYAQYIVTQMCFDADALGNWLTSIRERGINLRVWIGLPGAIERSRLIRTSLRIGVGDSLRFIRKRSRVAAALVRTSQYTPDNLVRELLKFQLHENANVAGYHLFCFIQVKSTENWRNETIGRLR